MTRPILVLVGPPGAGKTTVGELVATRRSAQFRDVDHDVEAIAGKTVADIFFEDGEETFRRLERDAVAAALASHDGVLALGGGAVLHEQTREALRGHTVVFLDVGLAPAVERTGLNTARPLLAVNPRATLKRMLDERRPVYEAVATFVVSTDGRSADEVADEIVALL